MQENSEFHEKTTHIQKWFIIVINPNKSGGDSAPCRKTSHSGLQVDIPEKNVSDNSSMDSFTNIYWFWKPKIWELDLFELILQNEAKEPLKIGFWGGRKSNEYFWPHHHFISLKIVAFSYSLTSKTFFMAL